MRIHHEMHYDATPEQVAAMLADPAFREEVCTEMRSLEYAVAIDADEATMHVVIDQIQPAKGIPSFATKFVGDRIEIKQEERWSSPTSATLEISIPGKPGHMRGTVSIEADGAGTTETVEGEVKVSIPLVGGKLESLIGDLMISAMKAEERVGRRWLSA
jgi:hypothetical protein